MKRLRAVAVLVVSVVLGSLVFQSLAFSNDVYAVNGLPFPIEVEINGKKERIEPDQHASFGSFSGELAMVARTLDGREIERRVAAMDASHNVYNPLGAAPLISLVITYSAGGGTPPGVTMHCGQPFVSLHLDYPFTEPPSTISVDSKAGSARRTALQLQPGGYMRCARDTPSQATAELLLTIAKFVPPAESRQVQWIAVRMLALVDQAALARTLAQLLVGDDPTLEDHRSFQSILDLVGDRSAVERYRKAYEAHPTPEGLYLLARALPSAESWPLLEKEGSSESPWVHRGRLWAAVQTGHAEQVLEEGAWCLQHNPELTAFCSEQLARVHLAQGRPSEAFEVVESALAAQQVLQFEDAVMVARLAAKTNRKPAIDPATRFGAPSSPEIRRYFQLAVGVDKEPATEIPGGPLALMALALRSPETALQRLEQDPFETLPAETAALLFGEAARLQRRGSTARLFPQSQIFMPRAAVEQWILQGEPALDLGELDPATRAALLLARARRVESMKGVEAARELYAQVPAADVLDGLAVRALKGWSPPRAITNNTPGALERAP